MQTPEHQHDKTSVGDHAAGEASVAHSDIEQSALNNTEPADTATSSRTKDASALPSGSAGGKANTVSASMLVRQLRQIDETLNRQYQAISALSSGLAELRGEMPDSVAEALVERLSGMSAAPATAADAEDPVADDAWSSIKNAMLDAYEEAESTGNHTGMILDGLALGGSSPFGSSTEQTSDEQNDAADVADAAGQDADAAEASEPRASSHEEDDAEHLESLLNGIDALDLGQEIPDEGLRDALADRDQMIRLLADQLRRGMARHLSADQLRELAEQLPEDLEQRVESALENLDRQVRLGELELSLERARLGRQMMMLQETRDKLNATARQFGMSVAEDGSLQGEPQTPQSGTRSRRWLEAMGFGN